MATNTKEGLIRFKRRPLLFAVLVIGGLWLAIGGFLLAGSRPAAGAVRVNLVRLETNPGGVPHARFQLENHTAKEVLSTCGEFQMPSAGGWKAVSCVGFARGYAAGTTNCLDLWLPTNAGPCRLMLYCYPTGSFNPRGPKSWLGPLRRFLPVRLQMRLGRASFPATEVFQIPKPRNSGEG